MPKRGTDAHLCFGEVLLKRYIMWAACKWRGCYVILGSNFSLYLRSSFLSHCGGRGIILILDKSGGIVILSGREG